MLNIPLSLVGGCLGNLFQFAGPENCPLRDRLTGSRGVIGGSNGTCLTLRYDHFNLADRYQGRHASHRTLDLASGSAKILDFVASDDSEHFSMSPGPFSFL